MTAVQPSASIVREPDRVRGLLCQSRASKLLDIAVTRTFVVASIGIVARLKPD